MKEKRKESQVKFIFSLLTLIQSHIICKFPPHPNMLEQRPAQWLWAQGPSPLQRLRLWLLKKYVLVLHMRPAVVSTYHAKLFNLTFFQCHNGFSLSWKITGDRLKAGPLLLLGCPPAPNSRTHSHPPSPHLSGVNSQTKPWSLAAICCPAAHKEQHSLNFWGRNWNFFMVKYVYRSIYIGSVTQSHGLVFPFHRTVQPVSIFFFPLEDIQVVP